MKEQNTHKMRPMLVYIVNKILLVNKYEVYLLLFNINCFWPGCIKKVMKAISNRQVKGESSSLVNTEFQRNV